MFAAYCRVTMGSYLLTTVLSTLGAKLHRSDRDGKGNCDHFIGRYSPSHCLSILSVTNPTTHGIG